VAPRELLWSERQIDKSHVLTAPLGPAPERPPGPPHWREAFNEQCRPDFPSPGGYGAIMLRGEDTIQVTGVTPRFEPQVKARLEKMLARADDWLIERDTEPQRNKEAAQRAPRQGATKVRRDRRKGT
jgi:hypothetical protein